MNVESIMSNACPDNRLADNLNPSDLNRRICMDSKTR